MTYATILVAGAIAVGKSAVAAELANRTGAHWLKVREALAVTLGVSATDRSALQKYGRELDKRSNGAWLVDYVGVHVGFADLIVIDAVRTVRQARPLLRMAWSAPVIYLTAHEATRRERYARAAATDPLKASVSFDVAMHHITEREAIRVESLADLVLPTDDLSPAAAVDEILTAFPSLNRPGPD